MTDIDVDALMAATDPKANKRLCYKTVTIFAGIKDRKLWLKNAADGMPKTNGYLIEVPFSDPRAYEYTEHELSHILFDSDALARGVFVEKYSGMVSQVAKKHGHTIDTRTLRKAITHFACILDDERVIALWGLLYPGSEAIMRRMKYDQALEHIDHAHDDLGTLLYVLAAGVDVPIGRLDRFRPYMLEALRKVHLRDFVGVLIATKWLVNMLVSELIRESQGLSPPPMGAGGGPGASQNDPKNQQGQGTPQGAKNPQKPSGGHGKQAWQPPDVNASLGERSKALQQLINELNGYGLQHLTKTVADVEESKFKRSGDQEEAEAKADGAMSAPVKSADELESILDYSTGKMRDVVRQALAHMRNALQPDDQVRQDAFAKVIFHDVGPNDVDPSELTISREDLEAVERLRAIFFRAMGRRASTLEDSGVEVDVVAAIQRRLTREPMPVFRATKNGRGFKALVLIDRSSSMEGSRTKQAERACRIISRALDFPFVESAVWGFQTLEDGEVDIIRFARGVEVFSSRKSEVGGLTPLHPRSGWPCATSRTAPSGSISLSSPTVSPSSLVAMARPGARDR
jgi:hypothetical protein